jgi:hypothetical protein
MGDTTGPYTPTVVDVIVVKTMLEKVAPLPPEILDSIVDYAGYWPHYSISRGYPDDSEESWMVVSGADPDPSKRDKILVCTLG